MKVSKFIFPVDFVVLEMDKDELVSIILGRPFLTTKRAVIDVHEGKLSLRLVQEQWANTVNHDGKWAKEEEEDSNEVHAVSFYPRTEPENNQLPVVISSALSTAKKARLLEVFKNYKGVIAWSIANIKGIDSSFRTHKILMEDEFKPSVQSQIRVKPNIKEVVKNEVIKLFDVGLIYPIYDSPWVSPVQVVPKKGRMNVVKNEKEELIL
ncbi:DNA-directed DNA polymerase [Tanacetum coccineum]